LVGHEICEKGQGGSKGRHFLHEEGKKSKVWLIREFLGGNLTGWERKGEKYSPEGGREERCAGFLRLRIGDRQKRRAKIGLGGFALQITREKALQRGWKDGKLHRALCNREGGPCFGGKKGGEKETSVAVR